MNGAADPVRARMPRTPPGDGGRRRRAVPRPARLVGQPQLEEDLAERPEDAARLEAERDAILGELRAATGLRGRRRPLGDDAERARKAVSGRLRDTIARLARLDPALGTHLEKAIETGATCAYLP